MKSYLGIDISKLHLDLSHPAPAKRLANTEKAIVLANHLLKCPEFTLAI